MIKNWFVPVWRKAKTEMIKGFMESIEVKVEQIQMQERRYEVHDGDQVTEEEVHAGQTRWYHRNEVLWMLQLAGSADDDMDLWPNHQFDMTPKGWKQWQNQQM